MNKVEDIDVNGLALKAFSLGKDLFKKGYAVLLLHPHCNIPSRRMKKHIAVTCEAALLNDSSLGRFTFYWTGTRAC